MTNALFMEQSSEGVFAAFAGAYAIMMIISIAIGIVSIVAMWKLFTKAGQEGWKSIIPIYNGYVMFDIIYGAGWKYFLMLVPVLNYVVSIMYMVRMAQVYGKGIGFGILNVFFSPITMCMLAFGDADYQGPVDSFL